MTCAVEPCFMKICRGVQAICRFCLRNLPMRWLHMARWYSHLLSFMKISTGVQTKLRFSLGNLKDCNVCITDGRDI
jgi:hypothetical protein